MPVLIHFYDKPALYRYSSILHRYVYTHIYTYLCTYIYFPEGMFTYFLGDRVQGWEMEEGRTNERAETDLNGRIRGGGKKKEAKRMQGRT